MGAPAGSDVYIISYPKSGRTWLRVLLGKALCLQYGLSDECLLDTRVLTTAARVLSTEFSHDGSDLRGAVEQPHYEPTYGDKKVVLLTRDARDVLVSSYYEVTRRSFVFEEAPCHFDGSLAEFVRSPFFGARKVAAFYEIWSRNRTVPKEFLLVRYEQLHAAPAEVLADVLRFIGARAAAQRHVAAAVDYARFENMRALEGADAFDDPRLRPGNAGDPDSFKVRRGRVGAYLDYLSGADLAYIDEELRRRGFPFAGQAVTA